MTIESLARPDVLALDEACTARDAARAMRDRGVGSVVVTRGAGRAMRIAGIVTDRDIAMSVAADALDPQTALHLLARGPLVTVPRDASVIEAARIMHTAAVRRLVLVDEQGRMVGIVSLDDLLGAAGELLDGLVGAVRGPQAHEAARPADLATIGTPQAPMLVSPTLAENWRHIVRT